MPRRLARLSAACALALAAAAFAAAIPLAAPPTDEQIQSAVDAYRADVAARAKAAAEKKERPSREMYIQAADEALKDISIAEASITQIRTLQAANVLTNSTRVKELSDRLDTLAAAPTADGFEAAVMNLARIPTLDDAAQVAAVHAVVNHPGAAEALKAGRGTEVFRAVAAAKPAALKAALPDILSLQAYLTPELKTAGLVAAASLIDSLIDAVPDQVAAVQPFRTRLLAAVSDARKQPDLDERAGKTLERYENKLAGAYLSGRLMDHPVPAIDLLWSNLDPAVKSVSDLKGKVVVLDFWATWCGPCVGSFPDVKKLQEHYEGYPVVILGVTSIQGSFNTGETDADGKSVRIDCKGDPQKEMALMPAYIQRKGINWKIAYAKQDVFNPDFNINGIPHVAVVDAKGIVRYRGLHPNSRVTSFASKVEKIDALLKEAGLPTPPPLPPEAPKN